MRFMVIVPASAESESGSLPDPTMLRQMTEFNEELVRAGVMLAGEGLHPSSQGVRLRFGGGRPQVIPGPFPRPESLVAGFWLIDVPSQEEAIRWMSRAPFEAGVELELRQVFETDEFAESDPQGEIRAREERMKEAILARQARDPSAPRA